MVEKIMEEERQGDAAILEKLSKWFLQKLSTPYFPKNHCDRDVIVILHWVVEQHIVNGLRDQLDKDWDQLTISSSESGSYYNEK